MWRGPGVLAGDLLRARGLASRQVLYSAGIGSVRKEEALGIWEGIRHKTLTLDDISEAGQRVRGHRAGRPHEWFLLLR